MRILLVEDDPLLGDGLLTALKRDGHAVDWLTDGQQAAHALHGESFELVLLDLSLPGIDGIEVIRRIRANPGIVQMPIFALTAHTLKEYEDRAFEAGCNRYLVKPFNLDELHDLVVETLDGRAGG